MKILAFEDLGPDDPYFGPGDHALFTEPHASSKEADQARERVKDKFLALHEMLYPEMERRGWDLHPHWHKPSIVSTWYLGRVSRITFMKLRYLRSHEDVQRLEKRMDVPSPVDTSETLYTKHPMLDVRIDADYFTIELLITEWAWWDAQNLQNKVTGYREPRAQLVRLLQGLGEEVIVGGWPDTRKPELVTTAADLAEDGALFDWMDRFQPGADWLRLGVWYPDPNDGRLTTARVAEEVLYRLEQLYPVYEFLLWSPENDYR